VNTLDNQLLAAGFVRCPNVAERWYPGSGQMLAPVFPLEIFVVGGVIQIVAWAHGELDRAHFIPLLKFADVAGLVLYLKSNGVEKPCGANVWD